MKLKKLIAIITSAIILIGALSIGAFAEEQTTEGTVLVDLDFSKISSLEEIEGYYEHFLNADGGAVTSVKIENGALKISETANKNSYYCLYDYATALEAGTDFELSITFSLSDVGSTRGGLAFNLIKDAKTYSYAPLYGTGRHEILTYIDGSHKNEYKVQNIGLANSGTNYAATETITAGASYTMTLRMDAENKLTWTVKNADGNVISDTNLVNDLSELKYARAGSGVGVYVRNNTVSVTRFTVTQYAPEVAVDTDTEPADTTPVDTTPVDTTPVDTTPVDTTPIDTDDTAPIESTPVDIADSAEDTSSDTEAEKSGCGATVFAVPAFLIGALGFAVAFRKKED